VLPLQSTASSTTTPTPTAFATQTAVPSPEVALTPTDPAVNLHPQVVILAAGLSEPDDLLLEPDGSILVSDVKDGTVERYGLDGLMHPVLSGLNEPEGMVLSPDGSLIVAAQGDNRLVRYDFASQTLSTFLKLVNRTGNPGVDNITSNGDDLIVPDSPNGTVLEVSSDGNTVRQLASGLVRPTGAWVEPDGNILLADEYGNTVQRLHPDGTLEKVAALSIPDDAISDAAGNVFAATLGDGAIHFIAAGTGADVVLVSGLSSPQGIVFDLDGNLIVTDSGHHQLLKVIIH